ncbi:MAG TPA: TonB-dependent receptor, partial [Rhizomicrobium sp.]|nr:TonB-dependent receptor [Rhizomicrobium sp.]
MAKHQTSLLRTLLLSGAAFIAVGLVPAAADDTSGAVETVVVTGTRIPRPEADAPNPVVSLGSADLQHSGATALTDFLKRVPALGGSFGNFETSGYNTPAASDASSLAGLDLLNLRNLGYIRTLTLIDGHRSVSESTGSAAVDTASIPITLIDRVDVATGGASAIYGADGVSGVVNFIMKHDLEGVHFSVQGGTSHSGGAPSTLSAISAGHNFDDGKGNLTLTYENGYQGHLFFTQRRFTRVGGEAFLVPNPNDLTDDPNVPDNIFSTDVQFIYSAPTGAIDTNFDFKPNFVGSGATYIKGNRKIGDSSALGSSGMPYAEDLQGDFQPLERRNIAQANAHYDFSDHFKISGEFKYANVDSSSLETAPFDDFAMIASDNPFLPLNVVNKMNKNGGGYAMLSEDYLQLRGIERVKRQTYRGVLDVQGDIPNPSFLDKFRYDVTYVYGQTNVDDIQVNNRITDRFFAALDAVTDPGTGKPTCRSNLNPAAVPQDLSYVDNLYGSTIFGPVFSDTSSIGPADFGRTFTPGPSSGCMPFNPFDPNFDNRASIAFMTQPTHTLGTIMQNVVTGFVSADIPAFQDMGMAAPLSVVLGGEWRKESSQSTPDAIEQGNDAWISGYGPVSGQFTVGEVFGEASLPIIKEGFVNELTIDAAVRQSHYSTAGDSTSWKLDAVLSPFEGLKFRATDAVAVRAPNIGELFAPTQTLFESLNDPCDRTQINSGTSFRPANCKALFQALGLPYNIAKPPNLGTGATTQVSISSNSALTPETARTITAGVVITPPDTGVTFTADWYRVNLTNAIEALSSQIISQECVDLSTIANPFCAQVTRTSAGFVPGAVTNVDSKTINVANFGTSGVEFTANWHKDTTDWFETNYGAFDFHLIGSYLNTLTRRPIANEAIEEHANEEFGGEDGTPAPRWQANLDIVWTLDPWSVDWNVDWYNGVLITSRQTAADQPDYVEAGRLYTAPRFVHDAQVSYTFDEQYQAYVGVNNVFYQKPSYGQNGYPVGPLGRFYYVGVRADLDF